MQWEELINEVIETYGKESCYLLLKQQNIQDEIIEQFVNVNDLNLKNHFIQFDYSEFNFKEMSFDEDFEEFFDSEDDDSFDDEIIYQKDKNGIEMNLGMKVFTENLLISSMK